MGGLYDERHQPEQAERQKIVLTGLVLMALGFRQGPVVFPLDYYTADEVAAKLSLFGQRIVASSQLASKVYLISLPAASAEKQLSRLCSGLGLEVDTRAGETVLGPDRIVEKDRDALRRAILENLLVERRNEDEACKACLNAKTDYDPGLDPPLTKLTQRQLREPMERALFGIAERAPLPDAAAFEERNRIVRFYACSSLPVSLVSEIDSQAPGEAPVLAWIDDVGLRFGWSGPRFTRKQYLVNRIGLSGDGVDVYQYESLPEDQRRKAIFARIIKGEKRENPWGNPGVSDRWQVAIRGREKETNEIGTRLNSASIRINCDPWTPFSHALGDLASKAGLGVLYEVNGRDEERCCGPGPIGVSDLLGEGGGYTATVKEGVLKVRDELSAIESLGFAPVSEVVKALRKLHPHRSIFQTQKMELPDYVEIDKQLNALSPDLSWSDTLSDVELPGGATPRYLDDSVLIVPVLQSLSRKDVQDILMEGKSLHIDNIGQFDHLEGLVSKATAYSLPPRVEELRLGDMQVKYVEVEMARREASFQVDCYFVLGSRRNPKDEYQRAATLACSLDDPFFKR